MARRSPLDAAIARRSRLFWIDRLSYPTRAVLHPIARASFVSAGDFFVMLILLLATTYTLMADSSDDIKAAINQTVEHMSFITRPIARGRLNKTNPLPRHVQVTQSDDTIAVAFDDGNPIATPLNGHPVPWQSSMTHEQYQAHAVRIG